MDHIGMTSERFMDLWMTRAHRICGKTKAATGNCVTDLGNPDLINPDLKVQYLIAIDRHRHRSPVSGST